jgi:hypothetical protein
MNRPVVLMSVVMELIVLMCMSYPVPAICKCTVDSILQTQTFGIIIIFGGESLCFPTGFHLGRCSAVGEGEWEVNAVPDGW